MNCTTCGHLDLAHNTNCKAIFETLNGLTAADGTNYSYSLGCTCTAFVAEVAAPAAAPVETPAAPVEAPAAAPVDTTTTATEAATTPAA